MSWLIPPSQVLSILRCISYDECPRPPPSHALATKANRTSSTKKTRMTLRNSCTISTSPDRERTPSIATVGGGEDRLRTALGGRAIATKMRMTMRGTTRIRSDMFDAPGTCGCGCTVGEGSIRTERAERRRAYRRRRTGVCFRRISNVTSDQRWRSRFPTTRRVWMETKLLGSFERKKSPGMEYAPSCILNGDWSLLPFLHFTLTDPIAIMH